MANNRRLQTDQDFHEAMVKQVQIRVFQNEHMVDSGKIISRFDDRTVVLQAGVSHVSYHSREACEFFELMRK
jgi:hypothetical protein